MYNYINVTIIKGKATLQTDSIIKPVITNCMTNFATYCRSEVKDERPFDTLYEINRQGEICAKPVDRTSDLWITNLVLYL
jgi:hypothetical protein